MIRTLLLLVVACTLLLVSMETVADDRFSELAPLVNPSTNILTFTSANSYKKYVQRAGRDYDIFVMLTASKNVGCAACSDWQEAYAEVAQTAKQQQPNEKIVFGLVNYDTLGEVFRIYNLNHAPVIIYVPADQQDTSKMIPKLTMNLANLEAAFPDPIAQFVSQRSGRKVEIIYSPWPRILMMCGFLLVAALAGRYLSLIFVPILRRYKWFWFIFSIVLYGLGVSGSIFSYLRNVPNFGVDQKTRKPIYFAGDRQQFFYEGIIIWGILVGGATFLVLSAYGRLPAFLKPFRPFFHMVFLAAFGGLFKIYVQLYLGKANWYKHGMSNQLTWPWV
jgi:hypothetical protein